MTLVSRILHTLAERQSSSLPALPRPSQRLLADAVRVAPRVPGRGEGDAEEAEEVATPTRRFTLLEITSGLPEDSRKAEECLIARQLRELRARVKAARAAVATTPGLAETLACDWQKAARFYARFGITKTQFRHGLPKSPREVDAANIGLAQCAELEERRTRAVAPLPAC